VPYQKPFVSLVAAGWVRSFLSLDFGLLGGFLRFFNRKNPDSDTKTLSNKTFSNLLECKTQGTIQTPPSSLIVRRATTRRVPTVPWNSRYIEMSIPFSAGALYSTTHDLVRWEEALFAGKLLSAESLKKMTTPFKHDYACGLTVYTANGHKVIAHGGGIEGFNTMLAYYPDDKLTVVVLGNTERRASPEIVNSLAAILTAKR
jgi:beta-lactamase family protein